MLTSNPGTVGAGFGSFRSNQMTTQMEANPLDKCTVVSVYPKLVKAHKLTISPGYFEIPPSPDNGFSILVVGVSSWWKKIDEQQPLLEIPCSSWQVANSIVNDFVNSLHGVNGTGKPGLFVVPGEYTEKTILLYQEKATGKTFNQLLLDARTRQTAYYRELVRLADIGWARTNGNPLAISDDSRLAAEQLGLKQQKAWMGDFRAMDLTNCKSCGYMVNPNYPICANCKNPISGPVSIAVEKK